MYVLVTVEGMNKCFTENMTVNLVFLRDQWQISKEKEELEQKVLELDD